jgi:hypothetical protein
VKEGTLDEKDGKTARRLQEDGKEESSLTDVPTDRLTD